MIDVEPLIRDELERLAPQPVAQLASWENVLERAGRRPRRSAPRTLLVAAAALAVAGAVASAYAVGHHFLVGDPAPPEVKEQAALLNQVKGELIPRVHRGPALRIQKTRLAASLDASTGRVYLWTAPTERGDICLFHQIAGNEMPDGRPNLGSGCGFSGGGIDSNRSGTRVRDGRWLSLIYGRVDESAQRLELRIKGRTLDVPLQGGFFLFELPGVGDSETPALELIAYDEKGAALAREKHGLPPGARSPLHVPRTVDVSGEKPLLEIETRRTKRPIRLYLIESDGERCQVLVSPGGTGTSCGGRSPGAREISVGPNQIGAAPDGMLLLWGEIGSEIETLEVRFQDGRVERLPLVEHFTLYQVARDDFVHGRRPIELVGRNEEGGVVARRPLGPWRP